MLSGPRWWAPKGRGPWCSAPLAPPVWPPLLHCSSAELSTAANAICLSLSNTSLTYHTQHMTCDCKWRIAICLHVRLSFHVCGKWHVQLATFSARAVYSSGRFCLAANNAIRCVVPALCGGGGGIWRQQRPLRCFWTAKELVRLIKPAYNGHRPGGRLKLTTSAFLYTNGLQIGMPTVLVTGHTVM